VMRGWGDVLESLPGAGEGDSSFREIIGGDARLKGRRGIGRKILGPSWVPPLEFWSIFVGLPPLGGLLAVPSRVATFLLG